MASRFGELLSYYRERCTDPEMRKGKLTQVRLGELIGYTGAAVSEWERGKSKIDADDRHVLIKLISALHDHGGLQGLTEADTLLLAGNYRPLNDDERRQVFLQEPVDLPPPSVSTEPDSLWQLIRIFLGELQTSLMETFHTLSADGVEGPSPRWSRFLIALWGWPFTHWSSERVLRTVAWLGIWLLTWAFTLPLLHWPFADRAQAGRVILYYGVSAFALPLFAGLLTHTKENEFWLQQHLATTPVLRFFTHIGAMLGFHLGYMTIFAGALIGYYFGLGRAPHLLEALVAIWPVLLAHAVGRQIPYNQWRAYKALRFADGRIWLIYALFGPLWGVLFWFSYEWLLLPSVGIPLLLISVAATAWVTLWQR